jgi:hypothetical protein
MTVMGLISEALDLINESLDAAVLPRNIYCAISPWKRPDMDSLTAHSYSRDGTAIAGSRRNGQSTLYLFQKVYFVGSMSALFNPVKITSVKATFCVFFIINFY